MQNEIMISVIVPVYNAERYLKRCLKSICVQTYSNLQIILVDDGSTDRSLDICNTFKERDNRIKVITKKNEGQGKARNVALEYALGEYIVFVDSDDYINAQMIEYLVRVAKEYNSDFVQCRYQEVTLKENINEFKCPPFDTAAIHEEEKTEERLLCYYTDDVVPVVKLIHKKLFDNQRFPENMYYEDKHLMFRLRYYARKIVYLDIPLYYYVQTPNSTMRQNLNEKKIFSSFRLMEDILKFCKENTLEKNYKSELSGYFRSLLSIYFQTYGNAEYKKYNEKAVEFLQEYMPEFKRNEYIVGRYRIILRCMMINFDITLGIFRMFNRIRHLVSKVLNRGEKLCQN